MWFCVNKQESYDTSISIEDMEFYCWDPIFRRLGCQNETIICNNSGFIANVFISNTKTPFNDEDISINRKSLVDLTLTGTMKTNDITIQNDYCRKVSLIGYNFYVTMHLFYNKKWNRLYSCKKFNASQDIVIEPVRMENMVQYNHI